jgi:heme A synthase
VPAFARFAWAVLIYNIAVVLWGAFVRATGSGAGCGPNWPLCNGMMTPRAPSAETLIEFTHRAMSGVDVLLVGVMAVWAFRAFPRRHPARLGATLAAVFLVVEALLGAGLVLLEHVAKNTSSARAWSMSTHLVNTLILLACLTLTAWWGMGNPRFRLRGAAGRAAALAVLVFVLLGVTGAIAALGDTLFPAASLAQGLAQDLNPASSLFVRLRWLHPLVAAAGGLWLMAGTMAGARVPYLARHARAAGSLLALQLIAGIVNLLLLAPVWMQIVHLLLADAAWVALVLLFATRCAKSAA